MVSINFRTLSSFIADDNVGALSEYLQLNRVDIDDRDDVMIVFYSECLRDSSTAS